MILRREHPADSTAVHQIHVAAFQRQGGEEPMEARLLEELRRCDSWQNRFSLVVESGDAAVESGDAAVDRAGSSRQVIAHAVCTRGHVGDVPVLALGPIAVRPDRQRGGAGSALVHGLIGAADATGEPMIVLLGSPVYYGRFGFVRSSDVGIEPPQPEWHQHFQVLTLSSYRQTMRGEFVYASPFRTVQ